MIILYYSHYSPLPATNKSALQKRGRRERRDKNNFRGTTAAAVPLHFLKAARRNGALRQESALYGRARCVPPPAAFASSGFTERFVWARTMRRLQLTDTLLGIPPAALLKSVLLVLPAAENLPFRPKGGRSARLCGILYPQSALSLPASSRPRRAGSRIPPAAYGDSVRIRGLRPPAGQASARSRSAGNPPPERSAARVSAKRKRCALYGSARLWSYGAGTRALTSCHAPPVSA